ncbi:glycosyltransferase family 4 protein [Patescibacteria group bacterium]|nr:glycosyltransferase family 4 protein [Patescibacteria group bacterium]
MAKIRVLHVACLAPPEVGGIGMAALREVEGLRARGHEALLVAPELGRMEKETRRPEAVRPLKSVWRLGNAAGLALSKVLKEGWDVVHLHYPFYGTAEWLLALPRSLPIVITFHMDGVMGGWREPIAHVHRWLIQPWLMRQARHIFVSSWDYAAVSSIGRLVSRKDPRLSELPFGIDLALFRPGPAEREKFSLPQDKTIFLMVGGLDRAHLFKGVPVAIRALAALNDANAFLAIRGDGDLKPSFEALAEELGVGDQVRFLPRCQVQELPLIYRSADILLFPSTSRSEAFGLVAVEAQACGTPVIASDLPGVRSVLDPGKTGWLVPSGDVAALSERMKVCLQRSKEEVAEQRSRAVAFVGSRYDQEQHLDQLIETYQQVCGSRS